MVWMVETFRQPLETYRGHPQVLSLSFYLSSYHRVGGSIPQGQPFKAYNLQEDPKIETEEGHKEDRKGDQNLHF